ncbi:restriction endonuclease subunit S [Howardella ureilytica]
MEYKRLGDIATYINGYAFKPDDRGKEGLPIIRIQDLTGNSYDLGFYDGEYPEKIEINNGDVLISWSASLGVYVWTRGKALLNQHIFKVSFDKIDINKSYFVYAVRRKLDDMVSKTHGATMKHIVKKDFDATQIPYPSLEEQAKIASKLDRVSRIIKSRNEELEKFDNLIKARFVEMFGNPIVNEKGWDVAELNAVCDGIGDGLHGTPEYDENGGYPFINGNNLMNGVIEVTSATKMVDEATYKRHYIELSNNAILLSINGTLGKLAFYNGEEVMLGKSACYCNLKHEINREFVYGVMKTDAFMDFLESNATASTIKNVGLKAIRGFKLILPPEELQTQFVAFSKQVDKSKFAELNYTA